MTQYSKPERGQFKETFMTKPLQLDYPVMTLDKRELLPAGAILSADTMDALIRSGRGELFPRMRLMEFGTVAKDLLRICNQTPYKKIFSNKKRTEAVFAALHQAESIIPLLEIYDYFKVNDPYTYRHLLTVYALSLLLGQDLLGDRDDQASLLIGASNHDFGKICVSMEICKKSVLLTEQERNQLTHHPIAGYVLLSYYFRNPEHPAAIVARDHHERRNAVGYPRGIRLENPIVEIVTACDLLDALVSPRPYRPVSFDLRSALEEITHLALSGALNCDVVSALVNCARGGGKSYRECALSRERRGAPPAGNRYSGGSFSLVSE
jgi:HD-GYP domain-containing protein (c-di-GMP phosphodiesterase class II)